MDGAEAVMASFWKLALGYVDEPAPTPFTSRAEWLAGSGVPGDEWGSGACLCDPDGIGPRVSILPLPERKAAKNRLHMDMRVPGHGSGNERWDRVTALVGELVEAGVRVLQSFPSHHVVMAEPEGNQFCVALTGTDPVGVTIREPLKGAGPPDTVRWHGPPPSRPIRHARLSSLLRELDHPRQPD